MCGACAHTKAHASLPSVGPHLFDGLQSSAVVFTGAHMVRPLGSGTPFRVPPESSSPALYGLSALIRRARLTSTFFAPDLESATWCSEITVSCKGSYGYWVVRCFCTFYIEKDVRDRRRRDPGVRVSSPLLSLPPCHTDTQRYSPTLSLGADVTAVQKRHQHHDYSLKAV